MKRIFCMALLVLLAFPLIGCVGQSGGGASGGVPASGTEALLSTYYSGQTERAFDMLQKKIFGNMLDGWTDSGVENPEWNYDSFARYTVLGQDLTPVASDKELYYCTYSAGQGKHGYVVMAYDGDSLERVALVETPYLYDLRANLNEVAAGMEQAGIDAATATAARVQLAAPEENRTGEMIAITDANGGRYACYFGEAGVVFEPWPA